jgi:hypothetical protein
MVDNSHKDPVFILISNLILKLKIIMYLHLLRTGLKIIP